MAHTILIVDDDADILQVLEANLRLHNFEVVKASRLQEAERILEEKNVDLVVLDLMLPDGDGMELCKSMRERGFYIPVIMLTAKDKISDKVLGLEVGADDYVVKPFEIIELVARIRACLRRYEGDYHQKIKIGELEIDPRTRTVRKRGREINLTTREFDLLYLLARNCGCVLSREQIKRALWKDSKKLYSWSRVIDVHIQHLRAKIEDDPSHPKYILTQPSVGYKIVEPKRGESDK